MRVLKSVLTLALLAAPCAWAADGPVSTVDQVIDRVIQREKAVDQQLKKYTPLIETYIQDLQPDKELGMVPQGDHYYFARAILSKGVVENSLIDKRGGVRHHLFGGLTGFFDSGYVPEGFLQMIYLDNEAFDRQHYKFAYIRREFLGEVRCLVFDLMPAPHSGNGRFKGRIWVEDQDYTIVRFNGIYWPPARLGSFNVHFDSWRTNVGPGVWVPSMVYSEETDLKDILWGHIRFRAQSRLWGYQVSGSGRESEFSTIQVEAPAPVNDQADATHDRSPIESQRAWQRGAEQNVVDHLELAGVVAPPGDVDKVMNTVVNNLEVSNGLDIEPEIQCRVLLTSTLESFTVGHTIIVSRGLLDVLPDEPTLAAVLAQELGQVMLGHTLDDRYAFYDSAMFSSEDTFKHFNFKTDPHDEELASQKAVELLRKSPYKDKLQTAGLFLKQLGAMQKSLPNLISPHLGNRVFLAQDLMKDAPNLDANKLQQVAALPLGSRIKLDPWTDQVSMLKAKPIQLLSAREKMPFELTPFMPYLTRTTAPEGTVQGATLQKKDSQQPQQ